MSRSVITGGLHVLIATAVVHQLVVSLIMTSPRPRQIGGDSAYALHQNVGLASVAVLALFWLWAMVRRREHGLAALFPWFSSIRRRALIGDLLAHLRSLRRLRLPQPGEVTPLASTVHGLGLLLVTLMATTGAAIYLFAAPDGSMPPLAAILQEVHKVAANLVWAYLVAHAGLALAHELLGHRTLQRMFTLSRRPHVAPSVATKVEP